MWTPRRVVLLLGGLLLFGGSYLGYARLLGWLDGLPQLPDKFRASAGGDFRPPDRPTSPTIDKLKLAFGSECPELSDQNYPNKLEFRNGESSIVLAAGRTPLIPNAKSVTLAPFSIAVFGKPKPEHLRAPGEVVEISTFHADKAVLEFDRVIDNPNDMNRAKLVRLELVSEPEHALPDPRRGKVHITNNQRSADPNRAMILRTPGPVFYREPKHNPQAGTGPDVWTDAEVEIIDRQNLPRGFTSSAPPTAPARGADLRDAAAVPAILVGQQLPPPTVTAIGMKIYFEPETKKSSANPLPKQEKGSAGFSGVQRIEFRERVLVNLWVDARQSVVGSAGNTDAPQNAAGGHGVPTAVAAGFGTPFLASPPARQFERALLQVETLGPFAYDTEKNLARFDAVPQASPNVPNDVQVTRILPQGGGQQRLFTQVLEIEFFGSPTSGSKPDPARDTKAKESNGASFRTLHAFTYTPGRFLTASSEDERLEAYGQDLLFDQSASRTILMGSPLYVVKSNEPRAKGEKAGGNVLTAGTARKQAVLTLEPGPSPEKKMTARVDGPGKFELVEAGANGNAIAATWLGSMTQTHEFVGGRELDRLTFTDAAQFDDPKADYWLKGKELKLWLANGSSTASTAESNRPLPHRLQATGEVTSHSGDFDIDQADFLNVMFRDGLPPPQPKPAPPVSPATPMSSAVPPPSDLVPKGNQPTAPKVKPKPPLRLRARIVDSWIVRYPTRPEGAKATGPTAPTNPKVNPEPTLKYELEKARCEGQVIVHQDPDNPAKPRGLDVLGNVLLIDKTPAGSVMTVTGTEKELGQVHHEGMSILGPKVVIDQLHNICTVDGRGALSMPAGTDLSGNDLKQAETLVVDWRDSMAFTGSTKSAEFVGKVRAIQGDSWVICHQLQVVLDREVYFNNLGKKESPAKVEPVRPGAPNDPMSKTSDGPKIDRVFCYPAPDDVPGEAKGANEVTFQQVERDASGKVVKVQQLTAREIAVFAQAQDDGRGDPYQKVEATGPGTVRIWQPGQRDMTGPDTDPTRTAPATSPKSLEMEMKLTLVRFGGRMTTKDKGKVYQEATFRMNVEVVSAPADNPNAVIERHRLPPRSMVLTCSDQMVVSTHKRKDGPPAQRMDAFGNAFIRSDEYDGWGETIIYDGQFVVLEGKGPSLARITSRYQNSETPGKRIVYDRIKNRYEVDGTPGGTIESGPKR